MMETPPLEKKKMWVVDRCGEGVSVLMYIENSTVGLGSLVNWVEA